MTEGGNIYGSSEHEESKFNLGLATQEDIREIMNDIRKVGINYNIKDLMILNLLGRAQHTKYKLVKQLFIRSVPLLKKDKRVQLKEKLNAIKIAWKPQRGSSGKIVYSNETRPVSNNHEEIYLTQVDHELDDLVIDIQSALQEDGKIFWVPKGEESLF